MIILKTHPEARLSKSKVESVGCRWIKRKGEFLLEIPENQWLNFLDVYPSELSYTIISGNPPENDPLNELRADIIAASAMKGITSRELTELCKKYNRANLSDMDAEQLNYLHLEILELKNQGVPSASVKDEIRSVAERIAHAWAYTDSGIVLLVKGYLWETGFCPPKKPDGSVDELEFNRIAIDKISSELKSLPIWIQNAIEATNSKESFDGWNKPTELINRQNEIIRAIAKHKGTTPKQFSNELAEWCHGQGISSHRKMMNLEQLKKVTDYLENLLDEIAPF